MRPTKELFEAPTKENLRPTKQNSNVEENLCLIDKVINVVQLLIQSDGETYCCRKNLLAHMTEITAINV